MNKNHRKQRLFKISLFLLCLAGTALVSGLRVLTGPEYALSLLYFVPIIAACWYISTLTGYVMALISALGWFVADLSFIDRFSHFKVPVINEAFRLLVFVSGVTLLSRLKHAIRIEQTIAMTDPLTGVYNRRAFEKFTNLELDRFRRQGVPFSILYIDIDDFKVINDCFGHHTGDALLKSVARTVQKNIRSIDTFSRLGGDEFILLLSGANKDLACAGARKIRNVLQSEMKKQGWKVTFSIGVVVFAVPPSDFKETVKIADEAMYTAKQNGKNQDFHREFLN